MQYPLPFSKKSSLEFQEYAGIILPSNFESMSLSNTLLMLANESTKTCPTCLPSNIEMDKLYHMYLYQQILLPYHNYLFLVLSFITLLPARFLS